MYIYGFYLSSHMYFVPNIIHFSYTYIYTHIRMYRRVHLMFLQIFVQGIFKKTFYILIIGKSSYTFPIFLQNYFAEMIQ